MLARWMKDWKTVCKLAAGPHYMHIILRGRLGLCQDRRAVREGAGPDQMEMQMQHI